MGLFKKKLSIEEILESINELSEEEKAELKSKMEGGEEVEEVKAEEVKEEADNEIEATEVAEENGEETTEEVVAEETAETEAVEEVQPQVEGEMPNAVEQDNKEEIITQLTERVVALEKTLAEFTELKEKMEEFTKMQADKFGYQGDIPSAKKGYGEMSADELRKELSSSI